MKAQARQLRYRPYSVTDEDEWSWVIWGLNGDEQSDWRRAGKRVSGLLLEMKELDAIREKLRPHVGSRRGDYASPIEWPSLVFDGAGLQKLNARGRQLIESVNRKLAFYKWSPNILTVKFEEFHEHPQWNARTEAEYQEKIAVHSILSELCQGRIDRFRICRQCTRWFYAVAQHQVSCSETCRKKHASTSEDFKEKRRDYMRKYRKQELAKNRNAKNQIKAGKRAR